MTIELLTAPLEDSRLQDIAALYGAFNSKYRDVVVCRRLFNENPIGAGVHAFVMDERGERIGHYGIVPLAIRLGGERRMSGKGEAFVVRTDCRDATVLVGDEPPLAIGLALPLHLYPFASAHGLYPVHMMAPPNVAPLHRLSGCRTVPTGHQRFGMLLRHSQPSEDVWGGLRGSVKQAAVLGRAAGATAWATALGYLAGRARGWNVARAQVEHFERVAQEWSVGDGWGLDVDVPLLKWFASWSVLDWIELADGAGHALVCSRAGDGRAMEVMHLSTERVGVEPLVRILAAVLIHAHRLGCVSVACSDHAVLLGDARVQLVQAARLLGLRGRKHQPSFLVYTRQPGVSVPHGFEFTPFFYAAF